MRQQRGIPLLMIVIDFFILGYSAVTIFNQTMSSGASNWFIYLLTYVIGDALMGLQLEKKRPLNVAELSLVTHKAYPVLNIMSMVQRFCELGLLVLLIISLFTKATWSYLGGVSLFRIVLYIFILVGVNYRYNQFRG